MARAQEILVGTSGWSYDAWIGKFYPDDLPKTKMLAYYAERFRTVEINNTFYRLPNPKVLSGWADQVPSNFSFVLKANQRFGSPSKLEDSTLTDTWYSLARNLGDKLGPSFFQIAKWARKDLPALERFLGTLPSDHQAVFEFRHPSWIADDTFELLAKFGASFCISETDDACDPKVATGPFGYLRLRKVSYSDKELDAWLSFVHEQPYKRAYIFFKHEDEGTGPMFAERFAQRLGS